ncbi:type II toxin-antitoxin system RelE/ParE family toxin [Escherichia fergusonii]|nr:hypothetical protein [Escherichia fergusonii]EHJ4138674.1 hypothetical protein [Escherichia fergusonii]EHK3067595.1 type II toxin-antitoxin system RelE/ParE family toxin [Escherichia fergusonii]EHK3071434.1 type II toxin-antitoxin system RelE/ParE family toxin [Escherichia fergusonii]EIQ6795983.1 type II toxin-antitoxin system RelE/ParE family toxin [Escherichia fergusonii]
MNGTAFDLIYSEYNDAAARDADGIYRVMYVAKFEEAVYVLHCFQKKTQTTSQSDIDLAKRRYKELVQERKNEN